MGTNKNSRQSKRSESRRNLKEKERVQRRAKTRDQKHMLVGDEIADREIEEVEERPDMLPSVVYEDNRDDKPLRIREVQVGGVPSNKFAHTRDTGRVHVKWEVFRKPSSMQWDQFKGVAARAVVNSKDKEAVKRVERRGVKEELLLELQELLVEALKLTIKATIYMGSKGQGARAREMKRLRKTLAVGQCYVIPDGGTTPYVLLPYKYVIIPSTADELRLRSRSLFASEAQDAIRNYDASMPEIVSTMPATPYVQQGAGMSVPSANSSSIPVEDAMEFSKTFGAETLGVGRDWLQDHWKQVIAFSSELFAFSLVDPDSRMAYLGARATSAWCTGLLAVPGAMDIAIALVSVPAVHDFIRRAAIPNLDAVPMTQQSFVSDLYGAASDMDPQSVVGGLLAVIAAVYTLHASREQSVPAIDLWRVSSNLVGKAPLATDRTTAVTTLLRYIPVLVAGITAAATARTWLPLFGKGNIDVRYANVVAAAELDHHKTYPNKFYNSSADLLADLNYLLVDMEAELSKEPRLAVPYQRLKVIESGMLHDRAGEWREAPFVFCIHGQSGIGKSSILEVLLSSLYHDRAGVPYTPQQKFVHQSSDKFCSGLNNGHRIIVLDDVANQRIVPGLPTVDPTGMLLDVNNNVLKRANMADLRDKNNVFPSPWIMGLTANTRFLGADTFSIEPVSRLRRAGLFIEPTVREQYRRANSFELDPARVKGHDPVANLFSFKISYARKALDGNDPYRFYEIPFGEDKTLVDLMEFMCGKQREHMAHQARLSAAQTTKDYLKYSFAELRERQVRADSLRGDAPVWASDEHSPAADRGDEEKSDTLISEASSESDGDTAPSGTEASDTDDDAEPGACVFVAQSFPPVTQCVRSFVALFPERVAQSTPWAAHWIFDPMQSTTVAIVAGVLAIHYHWIFVALFCAFVMVATFIRSRLRRKVNVSICKVGSVAAASAFVVWLMLRPRRPAVLKQQGLTDFEQMQRAVPEANVNHMSEEEAARTRTFPQLEAIVRTSERVACLTSDSLSQVLGLTAVCSRLYVTNKHSVLPILCGSGDVFTLTMTNVRGATQRFDVTRSNFYLCPKHNEACFITVRGPTEKDLRGSLMPTATMRALFSGQSLPIANASLPILRFNPASPSDKPTAACVRHTGPISAIPVSVQDTIYHMIAATPCAETKAGDCGNAFVAEVGTNPPRTMVIGIMGGYAELRGTTKSIIVPVTRESAQTAMDYFFNARGVHQSAAEFPGMLPGQRLAIGKKHPVLKVPDGTNVMGVIVDAAGANTSSLNTFRSSLLRAPMYDSPFADELLGLKQHTFPKDTTNIDVYQRVLDKLGPALAAPNAAAFDAAMRDVRAYNLALLHNSLPARPATLFEACNLTTVLAALPMNTAGGPGARGAKRDMFELACHSACNVDGCPLYHPTADEYVQPGRDNYYPKAALLAYVSKLLTAAKSGKSIDAIFKAAPKDEPVKAIGGKVRLFYVAQTALNLLVRMYYSPIFALRRDCARSETAVGVNILGPRWEEDCLRLEKMAPRERLCGDYESYDLTLSKPLLKAAYGLGMECAIFASWDPEHLRVMDAIRDAVSRPILIMLGSVMQLDGHGMSGLAVTSDTNSIANETVVRTAFYEQNPQLQAYAGTVDLNGDTPFTQNVALSTYGDDLKGAAREVEGVVRLNNYHIRDTARTFGMTFGPASKDESELPRYYDVDTVTFLKCATVHSPELGRRIGAIALASIRKCVAFERTTAYEARVSTCQSALRLYWPHASADGQRGREAYAALRTEFARVLTVIDAERASVFPIGSLPSYDEVLDSLRAGDDAVSSDEVYALRW